MAKVKGVSDEFLESIPAQSLVVGIDEVGRGPLVGNVVAGAVLIQHGSELPGVTDSKKLTDAKRRALVNVIKEQSIGWGIGKASPQEIDELNILQASLLAMRRAYEQLAAMVVGSAEMALIDGNQTLPLDIPCYAVIKGDARVTAIGAASILAKVERDDEMVALDQQYPDYGFAQHKGYPTKTHFAALEKYGPIDAHRRSFGPVRRMVEAVCS